jgi:5-methylcytosine-specific restriction enzyme subunit McrC
VVDAVGVVSIPGLQLIVRPKIPQEHLLFLLDSGAALPRIGAQSALLQEQDHLMTLLAKWFIEATERLLLQGLSRGYQEEVAEADSTRGRIHLLPTSKLLYRGRLRVVSEFETFDYDTPLNRLLLWAIRILISDRTFSQSLRAEALALEKRLGGIGEPRQEDLLAQCDRATGYYGEALALAKAIVDAAGRSLQIGSDRSRTFLIRTASPVERGIRALLQAALPGSMTVDSRPVRTAASNVTVRPDLVFDAGGAVGDVKYKLAHSTWRRPDLYQVVAYATASGTREALLIDFSESQGAMLRQAQLGHVRVTNLHWHADPEISAQVAAEKLVILFQEWLERTGMGTAGFEPATSRV